MRNVAGQLKEDRVSLLAAGVAFKALLALFPALIATITAWGIVADPGEIADRLAGLTEGLPEGARALLEEQMIAVAAGGTGALSAALVLAVLVALWGASAGVVGLMEGVNAAYNVVDRRSFARKRGLAFLLTVGAIAFVLVALALIAVLPPALRAVAPATTAQFAVRIAVWPLLAVLVTGALAVVYEIAPDRARARRRWITGGALVAALLWLLGSALFTVYVDNFGRFGQTYGALAGVVVLMLWLYLSAFVVLLGAEINAALELPGHRLQVDGGSSTDKSRFLASETGVAMAESVYKVIELVGTSTESWEKAATAAVERAGQSLRDLRVAEIADLDMTIEDGGVSAFRAKVKVSFKYEDE